MYLGLVPSEAWRAADDGRGHNRPRSNHQSTFEWVERVRPLPRCVVGVSGPYSIEMAPSPQFGVLFQSGFLAFLLSSFSICRPSAPVEHSPSSDFPVEASPHDGPTHPGATYSPIVKGGSGSSDLRVGKVAFPKKASPRRCRVQENSDKRSESPFRPHTWQGDPSVPGGTSFVLPSSSVGPLGERYIDHRTECLRLESGLVNRPTRSWDSVAVGKWADGVRRVHARPVCGLSPAIRLSRSQYSTCMDR